MNSTTPTSFMQSSGVTRTPRRPSRLGQSSCIGPGSDVVEHANMVHDADECRTASVSFPETPRRSGVRRPSEAFVAMTLDRLQASSGFGDKMLDGEGIKSPEHRLLRKLKKEARTPTLTIELSVHALSPVKPPPKSPVKSSRFSPYVSSPLRSHVRSAPTSPLAEVPSDPFLHDSTTEAACKPSSVGPIRHKRYTKSGAAIGSRCTTGDRAACSPKVNSPRIRLPQDPSPFPYVERLPVNPAPDKVPKAEAKQALVGDLHRPHSTTDSLHLSRSLLRKSRGLLIRG